MRNCPRTYCQGYWAGYKSGWNENLGDANGSCFPGMEQLILAKCISGVRLDSIDYKGGWEQAVSDGQNPVNGTTRRLRFLRCTWKVDMDICSTFDRQLIRKARHGDLDDLKRNKIVTVLNLKDPVELPRSPVGVDVPDDTIM